MSTKNTKTKSPIKQMLFGIFLQSTFSTILLLCCVLIPTQGLSADKIIIKYILGPSISCGTLLASVGICAHREREARKIRDALKPYLRYRQSTFQIMEAGLTYESIATAVASMSILNTTGEFVPMYFEDFIAKYVK